jgi:hypothetical protein
MVVNLRQHRRRQLLRENGRERQKGSVCLAVKVMKPRIGTSTDAQTHKQTTQLIKRIPNSFFFVIIRSRIECPVIDIEEAPSLCLV